MRVGLSFLTFILFFSISQAQPLSYYLPTEVTYDPAVPTPSQIIHHEVGEWHVTHDRLVNYMQVVAKAAPGRIALEEMGYTYEKRPQLLLIITSPNNHKKLAEIRAQHLALTDPTAPDPAIEKMPVVCWIGHSIHGNEASGANAALLSAYYLAAAQGAAIDELLENTVILFDPAFNPDGLQRFSTWANQHKSKNLVSDPNSREYNEVWPGGRFNHYWFDLNRDWLPAVHIESQNRLKWFQAWRPNVFTDHHEQGTNATFFFQPGVPSRVNPLTPSNNQALTGKLAAYHAQVLDSIGSFYFTKENYDDFYYGKGSTYPDIHGGVGILFEQASSRGHLQETANGLLSFPATIRNQFVTALSTLRGTVALRKELLQHQRNFYKQAAARAASYSTKGYLVGDKQDPVRLLEFAQLLQRHQIKIYSLPAGMADKQFAASRSILVPLDQPQHSLIRTIFEKTLTYQDSLFYDITAWTMPLAYGLDFKELNAVNLNGAQQIPDLFTEKSYLNDLQDEFSLPKNAVAILIEWNHLYAPAALNQLLKADVLVKAATQPIQIQTTNQIRSFGYGTLLIPVRQEKINIADLEKLVDDLVGKYGVGAYAVATGYSSEGVDLGSGKFMVLQKPRVALITGAGVNATDAGEVWHLLDQRMDIQLTHLEPSVLNRADLSRYTTIIMTGGSYSSIDKEKLKTWVQAGGTLIAMEEAITWAAQQGISNATFKKPRSITDSTQFRPYETRDEVSGAQQVRGTILGATYDASHPLAFGYSLPKVSLFKANRIFLEKSKNPYATPFVYGEQPLQSGWMSKENKDAVASTAAVTVSQLGSGRVINIADNPNFRAYWLGGAKLFLNAIFFSSIIDPSSARIGSVE
ncbi:MAG: zinc carboxypeptidase [Bacteroidetes bacterium]|nr:zinc carboxypeptidase [Bacteroidota bacterium]